ncbi:DUF4386 domain-containing protein [Gracilibacillus thailandensis]|uniref:DUF4386 family protein n=1 Tax=Gracilibacillus thailandensis TaxID=563735 RepID=A0A6N7QUI1_9BACI|nr:DUF4386 domain-containing protein [Gracilibacillus thailandensis]MRI65204.1 DUF4386 family protein [Gracilibacillus thailandensis]
MKNSKRIAKWVGMLYIIGTISGILSVVFTGSILGSTDLFMTVSANENHVILGVFFILIMGISLGMVAVIIYPIAKKYNETLALGYVVFRGALENFTYIAYAISLLLLVVFSKEYVNAASLDGTSFQSMRNILLDSGEQIQSLSTIIFSVGALMLYYLLYQTKLIPKWLSSWGLIAAIIYLVTGVFALFGPTLTVLMMPLAIQEMVMAVWLIIVGFNSTAKVIDKQTIPSL